MKPTAWWGYLGKKYRAGDPAFILLEADIPFWLTWLDLAKIEDYCALRFLAAHRFARLVNQPFVLIRQPSRVKIWRGMSISCLTGNSSKDGKPSRHTASGMKGFAYKATEIEDSAIP